MTEIMQGCDWGAPPPPINKAQANNLYLLSHVSNSNHLPPQKAVTFYKTFLQILSNPREAVYFFCPAALALFANLFDFPRVLCSPLSSDVALFPSASLLTAGEAFTAFPSHPPSYVALLPPTKLSRENIAWWSLRPDYCLDTLPAAPLQRRKHTGSQ